MATKQELFVERQNRMQAAVSLNTPDRVPIAPKMNFFYATAYGIPTYATLSDVHNIIPGLRQYIREFQPDAVWGPAHYDMHSLEALDCAFMRWPGAKHGLGLNEPFQILDGEFMFADEYKEFCLDPTNFILTKWLPRRYRNLAGLSKLNFQNLCEMAIFAGVSAFDDPEVRLAIDSLQRAAEHSKNYLAGNAAFYAAAEEEGVPMAVTLGGTCPFDLLSDNFRGMINCVMDVLQYPDELLEAIDVMTELCLRTTLNGLIAMGHKYLFIPLHGGVDEFMSPADYAKFYWPGLKKLMMAGIEAGLTPYVFCEGNYNTRLEQLCDVPKGKVVYMFEKVDMKRAKETVGQVACICGNLPTATLMYSKPENVADETKRLLDTCAPGGGFIMDTSIVIDRCPKENLHAMFDTTLTYGKY
ncbi:MAG: uroporphyrinogen decarboxylase family protein [Candidatus Heteroscillospira sp.]|jgi:hypothetical protein